MRLFVFICVVLTGALNLCARAQPVPETPPSKSSPMMIHLKAAVSNAVAKGRQTCALLDVAHDQVSDKMVSSVDKLDEVFARPGDPGDLSKPPLKFRLTAKFKLGEGPQFDPSFGSSIDLPQLKDRLRFFVNNFKLGMLPGDEEPAKQKNLAAGLSLAVLHDHPDRFTFDVGMDLGPLPEPFAVLQYREEKQLGKWKGRFIQQALANVDDHLGELTRVDFYRPFGSNNLFRSTTAAKWTETSKGVEMEQTFLLYIPLRAHHQSLAPSISFFGHKESEWQMDNYRANISYRRPIFRDWLYLTITPQIEFPEDKGFNFTPSIKFGFEGYFGEMPDR